ncbi:hypothetical protein pb186bvf_008093 [Paramecium bursaria]
MKFSQLYKFKEYLVRWRQKQADRVIDAIKMLQLAKINKDFLIKLELLTTIKDIRRQMKKQYEPNILFEQEQIDLAFQELGVLGRKVKEILKSHRRPLFYRKYKMKINGQLKPSPNSIRKLSRKESTQSNKSTSLKQEQKPKGRLKKLDDECKEKSVENSYDSNDMRDFIEEDIIYGEQKVFIYTYDTLQPDMPEMREKVKQRLANQIQKLKSQTSLNEKFQDQFYNFEYKAKQLVDGLERTLFQKHSSAKTIQSYQNDVKTILQYLTKDQSGKTLCKLMDGLIPLRQACELHIKDWIDEDQRREFEKKQKESQLVDANIYRDIKIKEMMNAKGQECPKCHNLFLYVIDEKQIRRSDESATLFYECFACSYKYKV